jgi:poly[(R)-3-hydroxyalkanoate] polymerase subunit PhaC
MSEVERVSRAPLAALELSNVLLTTGDAVVGATPRDVIWTHRETTLYRYRSSKRTFPVPLLLVFALINRPEIFDLRPGGSLVEYLLAEGFDVFLVDWGVPGEEDADTGFEEYVCDELHWAIREALRASAAEELTLLGWCMGATMCAMYCGLDQPGDSRAAQSSQAGGRARGRRERATPVRNLVLLTTPIDGRETVYATLASASAFDPERVAEQWRSIPGWAIDFANKLLKPVTNFWTTYRRLAESVADGADRRDSYQPMAKWVADNPPFPGRAFAQWLTWLYHGDALISGRIRLRGRRVDLRRIDQNLLVVTAGGDHIAPRKGTMPIFDLVSSDDVTHFDRPGGHIGLIAGSEARKQIWPEIADWLAERSER